MNTLFDSVIINSTVEIGSFLICSAVSIVLGAAMALAVMFRSKKTKSMFAAVAMLPVIIQVVIMMVNGNIGAGVAVAGAFSLVRFRSAPGNAKDIIDVFASMAIGLATGMGYIAVAVVFTVTVIILNLLYSLINIPTAKSEERELKIVIPESLDYTELFDDIFKKYTVRSELNRVKTTNMGSLYQLEYNILLRDTKTEKAMIDEMRCRNGNLNIICSRTPVSTGTEEL